MKTLIENSTDISKYVFADDANVTLESDKIITDGFIIADMNSENSTLVEGVTPPDDYVGNKYLYVDSEWVSNSDYSEPEENL